MTALKKILFTVIVFQLLFLCGKSFPDSTGPENEAVILIHGFGRTTHDMSSLAEFFQSSGYHTECPTLPTTFYSVEECTALFEQEFPAIAEKYDKLHFVGHSMGGLIIRLFLSRNPVPKLGRCVLIATPNQGTALADIVAKYFRFSFLVFKPLEDFQPGGIAIPSPLHIPGPEIGVIAGSESNLFLGKFLDGENDGRVPVDAVPFTGMKDFIVIPYGHRDIHHTRETALLVRAFIQNGSFDITAQ
ncbi:alpha/beta fold hydrolase [Candidatus Latescibacterota bacterium]